MWADRCQGWWAVAVFAAAQAGLAGMAWWTGSVVLLVLGEVAVFAASGCAVLFGRFVTLRSRLVREREISKRAAERREIADEVHDLVGHELSLIAMRAGLLRLRCQDEQAELAGQLHAQAERAVRALHDSITMLHDTPSQHQAAPADPVADDVESLVAQAAEAGAPVTMRGRLDGVSAPHRLTVYRIVREALTNASRHAPGRAVTVSVGPRGDELEVTVTTAEPPAPAATDPDLHTGRGLAALRRRVEALGGWFDVGHDRDAHTVTARLPSGLTARPAAVVDRTMPTALRTVARQAVVPVVVVIVLVLGFHTWASYGATVEPDDQAQLIVGMPAAEAEALMPDRTAPVQLAKTPDVPSGWVCRSYTDGNFPLAIATLQVCTNGTVVTRLTDLAAEPLR